MLERSFSGRPAHKGDLPSQHAQRRGRPAPRGSLPGHFFNGLWLHSTEAYESEVDQILKDANAKVHRLAEALLGIFSRKAAQVVSSGGKAKQMEALRNSFEDEKRPPGLFYINPSSSFINPLSISYRNL